MHKNKTDLEGIIFNNVYAAYFLDIGGTYCYRSNGGEQNLVTRNTKERLKLLGLTEKIGFRAETSRGNRMLDAPPFFDRHRVTTVTKHTICVITSGLNGVLPYSDLY
ncbi:hypothetical protein BS78_09G188500 [Paspalum vaginatum]|nr:hypothetical protein BS78_09G188500 [Paspalum vaginatum]